MDLNTFNTQASSFLQNVRLDLQAANLNLDRHWNADHICYRVATFDEYERCKIQFLAFSNLLLESPVGGRPISTFKLFKPLQFSHWQIDVIELPAPKTGKNFSTGFEHIEMVIDIPFSDLKKRYGDITFVDAVLEKTFNQELKIKLPNCSLKFHHLSLESVICLEKKKTVFTALQNLRILSDFQQFQPLIAGTFPLDVSTSASDVDVLMSSQDLHGVQRLLVEKYSHLPHFKIETTEVDFEPTVVSNFVFDGVPFEVFVQSTPSVRQRGYLHFLVEERLLKLGGGAFKSAVTALRADGIKTEPAFAKLLKLQGDPYEALLALQIADDSTLINALTSNCNW